MKRLFIWQITAIELDDTVIVSGTLLDNNKEPQGAKSTVLGNFFDVIGSYFQKQSGAREITFETDDFTIATITNKKGFFSIELPKFSPDEIIITSGKKRLVIPQSYPWYFKQPVQEIELISDIDDTVMVSHTAAALKRIYNILFKSYGQRTAVEFSKNILQKAADRGSRITYLSSNECNLFSLITAVFRCQQLPVGGLLLTPYLLLHQLIRPKKDKDYKMNHLKQLILGQREKKFILLGDDTQDDMEIYARAVELFKDQILKVFIRKTIITPSDKQKEICKKLQDTGVDFTYFKDADTVEKELNYKSSLPVS